MFEISLLDLTATYPMHTVGSLDQALRGAADACAALAHQRDIDLRVREVPPTRVAIDADRLTLVLINLVDNAIKHGRRGGRVEVQADLEGPRAVVIEVDDDGPGVPPDQRERIFAVGERGSTAADGSVIGLALVRMLLERVGGRVEVAESPLGGARFSVSVPRRTNP
jgi:signal transduction histidine kinase